MRFSQAVGAAGWSWAGQVSPPALWGKLPSHADYLQHGLRAGEVEGWQQWLAGQLLRPVQAAAASVGKPRPRKERWLSLEPGRYKPTPGSIPVAFVLPAGTLAFAPRQLVAGVMASSCDRLGREHPMIVYQHCDERWLKRCLAPSRGDNQDQFAFGEVANSLAQQNWLFWLARLVSRYVGNPQDAADRVDDEEALALYEPAERSADGDRTGASTAATARPASQGAATASLVTAVERLWALHAPGWSRWVGVATSRPTTEQLQAVLAGAAPACDYDAADNLRGVSHLPWVDWPDRLLGPQAQPAFWQQDAYGGYVGATERLAELWERR